MNNKFAYTSEDDKCYGITGIVISLNVFDNDSMLQRIDIDSQQGEYMVFTPDFFFNGNPRFSAKVAWNEMLKQYQLFTAMVLGNIMCRYMVCQRKALSRDLLADIHRLVEDDGRDMCQLENDEIDTVFDKTYNYLYRIYTNRQVHTIARGLVSTLKQRRSLSGQEVMDEIQYLRRKA